MTHAIINLIHREIQRNTVRHAKPAVGVIDSYDPNAHAVKVKFDTDIDDNGQARISGWIPIRTPAGGAGVSLVLGPAVGDQCKVEYLEGDSENGIVTGFLHNDVDQPPVAKSGEAILRHTATGNFFKLFADGSMVHYHKGTKDYTRVDKDGNLISHINQQGTTWVYLGGDPNPLDGGTTPTFARALSETGPSPFVKLRLT